MSTVVEERASGSSSSLHEKLDTEKAQGKHLSLKDLISLALTMVAVGRHEQIVAIADFDDPNIDKDAVVLGLSLRLIIP